VITRSIYRIAALWLVAACALLASATPVQLLYEPAILWTPTFCLLVLQSGQASFAGAFPMARRLNDCGVGEYYDSANNVCLFCPAGQYQDDASGDSPCKNCTAGYYSQGDGYGECDACPAGKYCPGTRSTSTLACPLGHYSATASSACTKCEAGRFSSSTSGSSSCAKCPGGQYQNATGQASCSTCPTVIHCYSRLVSHHQHRYCIRTLSCF